MANLRIYQLNRSLFHFSTSTALGLFACIASAEAQIVPDGTLGNENSRVVPNLEINGVNSDRIDGGAIRGANIFHSFQEFNINQGRGAYFTNPEGIIHIFSRVTGSQPSNILGRLGVLGNANLFLINPNGIVFGPNARLDLRGSFLASSADRIAFDGFEFSATNPQAPPILTVNVPIGLGFGENPGRITVQGTGHNLQVKSEEVELNPSPFPLEIDVIDFSDRPTGLQVDPRQTLALVGGEVILDGGNLTAFSGRIELGSVGSSGLVNLTTNESGWTLDYSGIDNFQDIRFIQAASATTRGDGNGAIQVRGRRISIADGSVIDLSNLGSQPGRNLTVKGSEAVELVGITPTGEISSGIYSQVLPKATGNGGDITIETPQFLVTGGAGIDTLTLGLGNGGNLTILTSEALEVSGVAPLEDEVTASFLNAGVQLGGKGKGGDITIETNRLLVAGGATLSNGTAGDGKAGNITVQAREFVQISGTDPKQRVNSDLSNTIFGLATGAGGNITIETGRLLVTEGGVVSIDTIGPGNGGNLTIRAKEAVEISGSSSKGNPSRLLGTSRSFFRDLFDRGVTGNNAGNITIETPRLLITDGAEINTRTLAQGNAGNITIRATELVEISGVRRGNDASGLFTSVDDEDATGNGGNIAIETPRLLVTKGGEINTSTDGKGNAGNITIRTTELFELSDRPPDGGFPSSLVTSTNGEGSAGDITVEAGRLLMKGAARIFTDTRGSGNAGSITIKATDTVEVSGYSPDYGPTWISTSVEDDEATGRGGDITIATPRFLVTNGARVETGTDGIGDAGNLIVRASELVEVSGAYIEEREATRRQEATKKDRISYLSTQTEGEGKGGNLTIETPRLLVTGGGSISTSAYFLGDGGNLIVRASDLVEISGTSTAEGKLSSLFASAFYSVGNGGNVIIETPRLRVTDGGQINTGTLGFGNAGNLTVLATDFVQVSGTSTFDETPSRLLASVNEEAVGKGGNVVVETPRLQVENGGLISVSDDGGNLGAGSILVNANTINLNNKASLNANTKAGEQGNITLNATGIQLRQNSTITTNAFGDATGGNITINTGTLAALENSDISADAEQAAGGQVRINAQAIFGARSRTREELQTLLDSDLLDARQLLTSDITAVSQQGGPQLQGTVEIETPDVDPSSGLVQLPENVVDATRLVTSTCRRPSSERGQFTVTGRGGLPPNPYEVIGDEATWMDLRPILVSQQGRVGEGASRRRGELSIHHSPIVEATGWSIASDGQIVLTDRVANPIPPTLKTPTC
ncbi:MAG TPA: filamentous hemagglutinin N-terminal domain-containing protein [Leptolyngbyaceae cyanobacterium]